MTEDHDPRGAALEELHRAIEAADTLAAHRGDAVGRVAVVQARATIELVEAVRDLTSLVALAMAPPRWVLPDAPEARESEAEGPHGADHPHEGSAEPAQRRLCDVAEDLGPGDVVPLEGGATLQVTASGVSEGAAWLEVIEDGGAARRVFVDALARDERIVLDDAPPERDVELETMLVASTPRIDADADADDADAAFFGDEGGEGDDFDVEV